MEAGAAVSQGGTGSPDWNQFQLDILCPLCDYNLRGLSEPRCPECGHQFVWAEVLSVGDRTHPYLFEHQPHRNLWSFRRTVLCSFRPRKFWRDLRPTHPPMVRRIILYWLTLLSLLLPIIILEGGAALLEIDRGNGTNQQTFRLLLKQNPGYPPFQPLLKQYGTVQAALDAQYPRLSWRTSPRMAMQLFTRRWRLTTEALPIVVLVMIWPWLTLASLLIFRVSLGRAKIKMAHVLRCVVYSSEITFLTGLFFLLFWGIPAILDMAYIRLPFSFQLAQIDGLIHVMAPLILLAIVLILTYRLAVAYRVYLCFPHAIATAIASQIMVVLTIMVLFLNLMEF